MPTAHRQYLVLYYFAVLCPLNLANDAVFPDFEKRGGATRFPNILVMKA